MVIKSSAMQLNLFDENIKKLPKKADGNKPPFAQVVRDIAARSLFETYEIITPQLFQRAIKQAEYGDTESLMALLDLAELKEWVLVETLHKRKAMVASKPVEIVAPENAPASMDRVVSFLQNHYIPRLNTRTYTLLDATYRGVCLLNNLWGFVKHNGKAFYAIKNEYRVDPRRITFGNPNGDYSSLQDLYLKDWSGGRTAYLTDDFIEGTFTKHFSKIRETNFAAPLGALGVTALILHGLKSTKLKDWMRYCENYGFPMLAFQYDALNDRANDREVFIKYGSRIMTEGSLVFSKDSTVSNMQVANQGSSGVFSEAVRYFEDRIIELILMQTNTTRNSYGSGSYANNEVYQSGEFAMVLWDSVNLEKTLNKEVETITKINFGEFEEYPKVDIKAEPPQDLLAELEKIAGLYALGVEIPISMIRKQFGISEPLEGEKVLSAMQAQLQASEVGFGAGVRDQKEAVKNAARELADLLPNSQRETLEYNGRLYVPVDSLFEFNADGFVPPESVRKNAQKVLDWKEEHGDEVKGMTPVGWALARRLASGEPISLDTVKRISQFNRHRQNGTLKPEFKSEPYKQAGHVAWLGWGGDEGIAWARKIVAEHTEKNSNAEKPKKPKKPKFKTGDLVRWNSSGGEAVGRIVKIFDEGTVQGIDGSVKITASKEEPAALITIHRKENGKWVSEGTKVGHKLSSLRLVKEKKKNNDDDETEDNG